MPEFAPVANLGMYEVLARTGILGGYHLLIATEVAKDLNRWSNFWNYLKVMDPFIIMDNGLIEAGTATDPQTLAETASAVNASCIVLPDVLGEAAKTIKAVAASYSELSRLGYPLMGVVQGKTWDEVETVVDFYNKLDLRYISIPRIMVKFFGTRTKLIQRYRTPKIGIHLLGFSDNLYDDIQSAVMPGVMGIDSATPLWYPEPFPLVPPTDAQYGPRPENYWQMSPNLANYANVKRVRQWLLNAAQSVLTTPKPQELEATP